MRPSSLYHAVNMKTSLILALLFIMVPSLFADDRDNSKSAGSAAWIKPQFDVEFAKEIKSLGDHPWAGVYIMPTVGDFVQLSLAPKAGVFYQSDGCFSFHQNYGLVTCTHGILHLNFPFQTEKTYQPRETDYFPIQWKGTRYLVATNGIISFCNDINSGLSGEFNYLRSREGHLESAPGFPFPAEYQQYILKQPVEATIINVLPRTMQPGIMNQKDTPVIVNKGKADGLRVGMLLHVTERKNPGEPIRLVSVGEQESKGFLDNFGTRPPQAGWHASTRSPRAK